MRKKSGFTLIEIMIVIMIIAILAILAMFMMVNNLGKSRDGKRKTDLDRLKIAFEEYYVDHSIYPSDTILSDCEGESLRPYLSSVPCDPKTNKPYCYIYDTDNNGQNYRILSSLEFDSDPIIAELDCDNNGAYCGFEEECTPLGYDGFNYGVSSSNIVVVSDNIGTIMTSPSPSPTPSPTPGPLPSTNPGIYSCSPQGICNNYAPNPATHGCVVTYSDSVACNAYCPTSPGYARCAN